MGRVLKSKWSKERGLDKVRKMGKCDMEEGKETGDTTLVKTQDPRFRVQSLSVLEV